MGAPSKSEVANQLHMFHNPFANKTSQPKIPDGKVNDSLGFQTQAVGELTHDQGAGDGLMHILLFPGQTSGMIVRDCTQKGLTRNYFIPEYVGSSKLNWSGAIDASTSFDIPQDQYAQWRLVSQGLQLKLLNSVEEDDGWWESIRVNIPTDLTDYKFTTQNNSLDNNNDGTIAPVTFCGLTNDQLVNESSYSTGLLRDLHRVQWELHGRTDYHDFITMKERYHFSGGSIGGSSPTSTELSINSSASSYADNLIEDFVDLSYDMVYIRIHPRTVEGSPTRLHYNLVSNQELCFDNNQRESRFHTKSHNAGQAAMGMHAQARRNAQNAANLVVE